MLRESNGTVRELLPKGTLYDVSDPAVSFDARSIAFAGTPAPDSAWRLYVVDLDGHGLRAVTRLRRGAPRTRTTTSIPAGSAAGVCASPARASASPPSTPTSR